MAAEPSTSSSSSSTLRDVLELDQPASSSSPDTARAPPSDSIRIPGRWSDTLSFASFRQPAKQRSKRPALPGLWASPEEPAARRNSDGDASDEPADDAETEREKEEQRERDRERDRELSRVAEKVLYQTGTDSGDPLGPLLVIAPVYIPPPTQLDHALLFDKLRLRLETFASSCPYSVVLLTTPAPNAPPTALLISTYLGLTRMARKNLRKLWVVGGGWWVRMIFTIFSTTLLSGKTAKRRKIVQVPSLSTLASEMGVELFTRVEFPHEVYSANAAIESSIKLPVDVPPRALGVSLEEVGSEAELGLPVLVKDCVNVLRLEGLDAIGVFRRSASAATVKQLQDAYDRGHPVTLLEYPDAAYLAASLLKLFLRSLPTPIFAPSLYPLIRSCPISLPPSATVFAPTAAPQAEAIQFIRTTLLPAFSKPTLLVLQPILSLLHEISLRSETNLMGADNLVICLAPGMVGGLGFAAEELEMCRVPGTMRRTEKARGKDETNTVGGVLRVMIEA
ncbi:hypothetical protein MNV49_000259 [Pseudohyphozyma bogoriensis]|nr:hypothetical protein MNV49_000259 [Pseudohyphozyma bogoriensis]